MDNLYHDLVRHTGARPDRHGECHISCPECGKETKKGQIHFSFSERGGFCFCCGHKVSLSGLAEKLGFAEGAKYTPVSPPRVARINTAPPSWMLEPSALLEAYTSHPERFSLWRAYKPLPVAVIEEKRLGVGVLPASKCRHPRLILPVFWGTALVGLRGRAIDCSCAKWLAPGGTRLDLLPLYNHEALTPGCVAWLVENPVDALMLTEKTGYVGLATYSTAYWREAWAEALKETSLVVVAFDNDIPGNGGGRQRETFVRDWLRTHAMVPEPRGVQLVNQLLKTGLNAVLYDWGNAPVKTDIGSMLMQEIVRRSRKCLNQKSNGPTESGTP